MKYKIDYFICTTFVALIMTLAVSPGSASNVFMVFCLFALGMIRCFHWEYQIPKKRLIIMITEKTTEDLGTHTEYVDMRGKNA